jgi:predicted transcriptional regulator
MEHDTHDHDLDLDHNEIDLTADIVASYVAHNSVPASELPALINSVHQALKQLGRPVVHDNKQQEPAISVRKSVTADYIICLEDGKKFKSLKRHLHTRYNMTPSEYRAKWGLPSDYPMVAPNYSAARSNLANAMGLGRKAAAAKGRRAKG